MALLSNVTKEQAAALGTFFQTLQQLNDARDYLKTRGPNARGALENLTAAEAANDEAIRVAAEAFTGK